MLIILEKHADQYFRAYLNLKVNPRTVTNGEWKGQALAYPCVLFWSSTYHAKWNWEGRWVTMQDYTALNER